jgi:hypothetical protein
MTATDRERKGVALITKITESHGKRVFKEKKAELSSNRLDEADAEMRRRYMRSKYTEFFGSNVKAK